MLDLRLGHEIIQIGNNILCVLVTNNDKEASLLLNHAILDESADSSVATRNQISYGTKRFTLEQFMTYTCFVDIFPEILIKQWDWKGLHERFVADKRLVWL